MHCRSSKKEVDAASVGSSTMRKADLSECVIVISTIDDAEEENPKSTKMKMKIRLLTNPHMPNRMKYADRQPLGRTPKQLE